MSLSTQSNNQVRDVLISSSWADEVEETESLTSSNLASPIQTKKPENSFPKGSRNNFNQGQTRHSNSYQNHKKPEPRTILRRENGPNFSNNDQFNHHKNSYQTNYRKKSQESLPVPITQNRLSSSAPNHSRSFKNRNNTSSNDNSPPNSEYPKENSCYSKVSGIPAAKPINGSGLVSSRWFCPEEEFLNNSSKDHKSRNNDSYNPNRNYSNNFSKNNSRGRPGHPGGDFPIKHKDIPEEKCTQHIKGPEAIRWNAAESALQNIGNAIKQNETNTCKLNSQKSPIDLEVTGSKPIHNTLPKKGLGYRSTCRLEWVNCPKDVSYIDVLTLYGDFKDDKTISVSYFSSNTLHLLFATPDDAELAIRRHTLMAREGSLRRIPQNELPKILSGASNL